MNINAVLDKLQAFRNAEANYRRNDNLSQAGLERALKNLKQEQAVFRQTALQVLKDAWDEVRIRYELIGVKRELEDVKQGRSWDYNALNYNALSVTARIQTASSVEDVAKWYPELLQSGNRNLARAAAEAGASALRAKYGYRPEVEDLARLGDARFKELIDSPVYHEVQAEGDRLIRDVQTLQGHTKQVKNFYQSDVYMWGVPDDFDKVSEGITLSEHFDSQVAKFKITLDIQDAPAGQGVPASAEGQAVPA